MTRHIKSKTSDFTLSRAAKRNWLKALRSGEYQQGRSHLYNKEENTWCCLGVLCHVIGVEADALNQRGMPYELDTQPKLPKATELSTDFGIRLPGNKWEELSHLNDTGKSFKEIADLISKYVPCHD